MRHAVSPSIQLSVMYLRGDRDVLILWRFTPCTANVSSCCGSHESLRHITAPVTCRGYLAIYARHNQTILCGLPKFSAQTPSRTAGWTKCRPLTASAAPWLGSHFVQESQRGRPSSASVLAISDEVSLNSEGKVQTDVRCPGIPLYNASPAACSESN